MVYYYEKKLPSIDDIVIAKVKNISAYGVEVTLNEYDGIKGFINCNEVSRKKKVNLHKILTIGKDIFLNVIQVYEDKCYIDLSKRTITEDEIKQYTEKHKLHIQLYNLFKHLYIKIYKVNLSEKINDDLLHTFMCNTLFKIQQELENDYILEKIFNKETLSEIINLINYNLISNEEFISVLNDYIDNKVNRIKPELNENIKLMTYLCSGLADIKYTLDYKSFSEYIELDKDYEIKINYISGSNYSIILEQRDFELTNNNTIENALLLIKKEIKKRAVEKNIQNQILI